MIYHLTVVVVCKHLKNGNFIKKKLKYCINVVTQMNLKKKLVKIIDCFTISITN